MSTNSPPESNAEVILAAHRSARRARSGALGSTVSTARAHDGIDEASMSKPPTLAEVVRQNDALLKRNLALTEEVAVLAEALAKANRCAFHDELTGLPNRRLLLDHFEMAVARAARKHNHVALLFIDLDGFKNINDSFGHLAADSLLQQVAARLASCTRSYDTACRYGGDEFVVLLPHIDREEQAVAAQGKIVARLALPYLVDRTPVKMTASIGLALYPIDGKDCAELLKVADHAMYHKKVSAAGGALGAGEFELGR